MPRRAKRKAVTEGDEEDSKSANPSKTARVDDTTSTKDDPVTATTAMPNEQQSNSDPKSPKKLMITEEVGDIFDAPDNAVIIHACNCLGHCKFTPDNLMALTKLTGAPRGSRYCSSVQGALPSSPQIS